METILRFPHTLVDTALKRPATPVPKLVPEDSHQCGQDEAQLASKHDLDVSTLLPTMLWFEAEKVLIR
jgi:hypothetical protein